MSLVKNLYHEDWKQANTKHALRTFGRKSSTTQICDLVQIKKNTQNFFDSDSGIFFPKWNLDRAKFSFYCFREFLFIVVMEISIFTKCKPH